MASFPPDANLQHDGGRVLWRIDSDHPRHVLYVSSPELPDFTGIREQGAWATSTWDSTDYRPFLNRLSRGQKWEFRFTGNPTKSIPNGDGRGVVRPHLTVEHQSEWFLKKSESSGFAVLETEGIKDFAVIGRQDSRFRRNPGKDGGSRVTIKRVDFKGSLEVTDAEALRCAMVQGIGRGKGYGCGLLTLKPIADRR